MIQTNQKSPEALDQNERKTLQRCWATLWFLIEPCLRFFEGLQGRSHEIFIKRVSSVVFVSPISPSIGIYLFRDKCAIISPEKLIGAGNG